MSLEDESGGHNQAERSWCHTQFHEVKTSLTWRISDFSKSNLEVGECIESAEFGFDGEKIWNLQLYPNGETEAKKDFVAVYIIPDEDEYTDRVTCHISIMDSSGELTENKKLTYSDESTGWEEFISRDILFEVKDLLLPDDVFTMHCELIVVRKVEKNWKCAPNRPRSSINIKDKGNKNTLDKDLGMLLKNGDQFSDVVFEVGDAKVSAHRVMLMARSPVFAAMFQQDMLETQTNTVAIKDIEVHVFRQLLSYMSTNDCTLPNVHFSMQLLAAADKYDIPSLKTLCADYLNENLTEQHVFDVVACADSFGEEKLRQNCVEFICARCSNILAVDADWKTKSRSNPEVLESILQRLPGNDNLPENSEPSCSIESKAAACHSRFVINVGNLMWRISGFSLCELETGEYLQSPEFDIRGEKKKFYLKLYPTGQDEEAKGFVSLYLYSDSNDAVHIQCEISITNTNAKQIATFKFSNRESFKHGRGWLKYISAEELSNNLPNDELLIFCEITVSKSSFLTSKEYVPSNLKMTSLAQDIGRIFEKHEFADFSLAINETKIPTHKIILISRSSVFATMIEANKTEKSLKITDTKEDVFRELLRFIYTDQCWLKDVDFASEILVAAHKYDVQYLKEVCLKYLYDHMSVEKVCDVAILALSLQETQLYKDCLDYIGQELPSVNLLVWPMKQLHSHPEILQDVFERYVAQMQLFFMTNCNNASK